MDRTLSYARLVPASLLPPEDPTSDARRRTVRDWYVDIVVIIATSSIAAGILVGTIAGKQTRPTDAQIVLDAVLGVLTCVLLWWRRRHPVQVATVAALASCLSVAAGAVATVALFTVAVHRRLAVVAGVALLNIGCAEVYYAVRPQDTRWWVSLLINVACAAVVVAWGMFVRARRQLVWTLRRRAERAEAEQRMLADQARTAERTRIAREMHDVLAHRISLVALHAGGLQVRPDLPAEQVQETATLLRATAQQALEELRDVIGVLRDEPGDASAPAPPQPTLRDIPRLVDDTRRTGAKIDFEMAVPDTVPDTLGRDAYRIVQEALTNVAKHARGTATRVRVSGAPGDGLHVDVRNRLPVAAGSTLPGSGTGLLGLQERVTLTGGTLTHGPDGAGEFVVDARLAWR